MIPPVSTGRRLDAAVAEIEGGHVVAVAGPPGSGKTGVLLSLLASGGRPVAFERAELSDAGVSIASDNVRIRARHLHLLHGSVRLAWRERVWLSLGAAASHLPGLGPRIGRRCFVDVPASAVADRADADRIDLVVILDPEVTGAPRPASPADLGPYLGPGPDQPVAFVIGTHGRSSAGLASVIGDLVRQHPC